MSIGIYKITSPSGKIYIGQSINLERRFKEYKSNLNYKKQPKINNSFQKYGYINHKFEIIEECSIEQLNEKETFWKLYYLEQNNNDWSKMLFCELYDRGGGPKSDSTKQKMSQKAKIKNNFNITSIKKHIIQYDLKGNFIKEWSSITEASKTLNIGVTGISQCCKYIIQTSYNYIWRFKNDPLPLDFKLKPKKKYDHSFKNKKIIQYDLKGNFIREWDSIKDATKYFNSPSNMISNCCRGKIKTAHKFKWKYKEN